MILRKGKMFYNTIGNQNAIFCVYKIPTFLLIWKTTYVMNGDMMFIYFDSFTSQSTGIAIFINNNFEYKVHNTINDNSNNFLALDIDFGKYTCNLSSYLWS